MRANRRGAGDGVVRDGRVGRRARGWRRRREGMVRDPRRVSLAPTFARGWRELASWYDDCAEDEKRKGKRSSAGTRAATTTTTKTWTAAIRRGCPRRWRRLARARRRRTFGTSRWRAATPRRVDPWVARARCAASRPSRRRRRPRRRWRPRYARVWIRPRFDPHRGRTSRRDSWRCFDRTPRPFASSRRISSTRRRAPRLAPSRYRGPPWESAAAAEEAEAACDVSAEDEASPDAAERAAEKARRASMSLAAVEPVVAALRRASPRAFRDVSLLVSELARVAVLEDEEFLASMRDLHADVARRSAEVRHEAARLGEENAAEPSATLAARRAAVMMPAVASLDRLASRDAQSRRGGFVTRARARVRQETPRGFTRRRGRLRRRAGRRGGLARGQIRDGARREGRAPTTASAPSRFEPGARGSQKTRICRVDARVRAGRGRLRRIRRRPRRLGRRRGGGVTVQDAPETRHARQRRRSAERVFLLKGHEDLRLDERVMSTLSAANDAFASHDASRSRRLSARTYTVTPLAGRGGLIRWVERATPLSAMFSEWQRRARHAAALPPPDAPPDWRPSPPPVAATTRPLDLFYQRVSAALRDAGMSAAAPRRAWPRGASSGE